MLDTFWYISFSDTCSWELLANKEAKAQKAERLKKQAEAKAQKEAEEAANASSEETPVESQGE